MIKFSLAYILTHFSLRCTCESSHVMTSITHQCACMLNVWHNIRCQWTNTLHHLHMSACCSSAHALWISLRCWREK